MSTRVLLLLCAALLLSACGSVGTQPSGNGGDGLSIVASLASTPAPEAFAVGKGQTQTLLITVKRSSAEVAKVKLSVNEGPLGVTVSPAGFTAAFSDSDEVTATFTVRVDSDITNTKPDFYIYGQPLSEKDKPIGSETLRLKYQWSL